MTGSTVFIAGNNPLPVGNLDDGLFQVTLPFSIIWGGQSFSTIWVSTNSYVLFNTYMTPSYEGAGPFSASNWSYATNSKIFISAADNSCQQLTTSSGFVTGEGVIGQTATIRYEGCSWNGTTTPRGQSDIIWELTFYSNMNFYNKAILDVILNGRITNDQTSYSALCGGSTQLQAFTPSTASRWLLELGPNQSTWSVTNLPYSRKKKLVVSGGLGIMAIGDEDLPVGNQTFDGGAITDPETYRNQLYFHSNLPYIKIAEFVTIPSITYPALEPDLRTWADPGSGGCGGGCF